MSPDQTQNFADNVTRIAKVCHEANRAYCEGIGDTSQMSWEEAPDWQRESALHGVFQAMQRDAKPSDSHESWLREKLDAGWKYGPTKNPETKEHPCCVPFDELPPEQQAKDKLFLAVARALLPEAPPEVHDTLSHSARANAPDTCTLDEAVDRVERAHGRVYDGYESIPVGQPDEAVEGFETPGDAYASIAVTPDPEEEP